MSHSTLQGTLVEVTDGLAHIDSVRLLGFHPHPQAKDSFVADVEIHDTGGWLALRSVAENIFHDTGNMVLFRQR